MKHIAIIFFSLLIIVLVFLKPEMPRASALKDQILALQADISLYTRLAEHLIALHEDTASQTVIFPGSPPDTFVASFKPPAGTKAQLRQRYKDAMDTIITKATAAKALVP